MPWQRIQSLLPYLRRIGLWSIYGVLAAVAPLGADYLSSGNGGKSVSLISVLSHGQLLLVAAAIGFPALGAVVMSDLEGSWRGVLCGLLAISLLVGAILYARWANGAADTAHHIAVTSGGVFLETMIVSALCIAAAEA